MIHGDMADVAAEYEHENGILRWPGDGLRPWKSQTRTATVTGIASIAERSSPRPA